MKIKLRVLFSRECQTAHVLIFICLHQQDGVGVEYNQNPEAEVQDPLFMPSSWRRPGMYQLQYQHASCPGAKFGITCIPLGPFFMVHGKYIML